MKLSETEKESCKTPTATLMGVMEEFGKSEPIDVVVLWIDESGEFCWSQSTRSRSILLGLIEMVKQLTVHDMLKERQG
jgi:hypothetical protein